MGCWLKKAMGTDEQDDWGLGCLCGRREASPGEAGMRDGGLVAKSLRHIQESEPCPEALGTTEGF